MIAVDTNVVVRFIVRDDAVQTPIAIRRVAEGAFIADGVLMETEWVLRGYYGWSRTPVNGALRELLAVSTIHVRNSDDLLWALERHGAGADWADMLHLVSAASFSGFASFEKRLTQKAGPRPPTRVIQL